MTYVTSQTKNSNTRWLFFSTIFPEQLEIFCAWKEKSPLNQTGNSQMQYISLLLYIFKWNIEVSYYEQKTFWSLCSYMVRSQKGIEMLVNLKIQEQIFYTIFVENIETHIKSNTIINTLKQLIQQREYHL